MLQHMDKYSDSFTLDASEESLREVFVQIDRLVDSPDSDTTLLTPSDIVGMIMGEEGGERGERE